MAQAWNANEVQEFYERWSASVFTFCRCFLGEQDKAEAATQETFMRFLRESPDLPLERLPLGLLRRALESVKGESSLYAPAVPQTEELEDIVALLSQEERAVFILRGVLDLSAAEVALATGTTSDQVNQLWMRALMSLRKLWLNKG